MSTYSKTILCLANSRKITGRCVAGREVSDAGIGRWVRPVSSHGHGEVSESDRRFSNGIDPKVGDIIEIPMLQPKPHLYQVENHLIDAERYWSLVRKATPAEIDMAIERNGRTSLWNISSSTRNGLKDRVLPSLVGEREGSLAFIEVTDLEIQIVVEGAQFNNPKRKMRGQFTHDRSSYRFAITDPVVEREFFLKPDGMYKVGRSALCISLGDVHDDGFAYKLIAGVIRPTA